jgi:hypothetical protein
VALRRVGRREGMKTPFINLSLKNFYKNIFKIYFYIDIKTTLPTLPTLPLLYNLNIYIKRYTIKYNELKRKGSMGGLGGFSKSD